MLDRFRAGAASAGGRVSAVVLDPSGREVLALHPDEQMTAASVIKLPLVMTLFHDAAEGRIDLDQRVAIGARVDGSGVLRHLPGLTEMTTRDLATLTMIVSDNTATNLVIERVGVDRVNERLDEWGCPRTRLRRGMYDLEAKARGLENVMTARETASLLGRVLAGARAGDAPMRAVLELLERNSDQGRLGRYLTPSVALAHKDGWLTDPLAVDNDAGIVTARSPSATASPGVVAVGSTEGIDPLVARPLLGLLGLAAAQIAGIELGALPSEVVGTA